MGLVWICGLEQVIHQKLLGVTIDEHLEYCMGAWCGRFALTTSRENFTTTEKVCANNSWCRFKIDDRRKL